MGSETEKFDNKIPSRRNKPKDFKPKRDEISFDAKAAKAFIGQKMYFTLSDFYENKFHDWYEKITDSQKIVVNQMFFNTYFPKEVKVDNVDPFDDWSTDELQKFKDTGVKPKGKIIYTVK